MRAGAATKPLIFPEDFLPVEGFTRCMDTLHARVLVLEEKTRHALLVLEMTSLPPEEIETLSRILREQTQADHCHILVTHTFSAPHFQPDFMLTDEIDRRKKRQLKELVYAAVQDAAGDAVESLEEASCRLGVADCDVATARDVLTPDGWWVGSRGEGPVDPRMSVLYLAGEKGSIAALVHYSVQSSVLDGSVFSDGGKPVSGDLAGRMASELEGNWGCPVLFLIGGAGDQAPGDKAKREWFENGVRRETDLREAILPLLEKQAAAMASAARNAHICAREMGTELEFRSGTVTLPGKQIQRNLRLLHPTKEPPYQRQGESEQTVTLLSIGGWKLIGVRPEVNCITARQITGDDPMVRVVTLWNGGAKYLADWESCQRITYESQNSPFYPGSAELLVEAARALLTPEAQ